MTDHFLHEMQQMIKTWSLEAARPASAQIEGMQMLLGIDLAALCAARQLIVWLGSVTRARQSDHCTPDRRP